MLRIERVLDIEKARSLPTSVFLALALVAAVLQVVDRFRSKLPVVQAADLAVSRLVWARFLSGARND